MADYTLGGNSESASNLTKPTIRIPLVDKQVALASQMKEIDGDQLKILLDVEAEADAAEAAAKAYADTLVVGLLDDRGNHDASGNTFPSSGGSGTAGAIKKGDVWTISVAGTLGSKAVTAGDVVRALVDTPGQTEANWVVTENNIGYVPENSSNKSTDGTLASNSNTKYPTEQAVKTYVDNNAGGGTEIVTSTASGVQTNLNIGANISKNIVTLFRWSPTSMAILQSINTTNWQDGKIVRIMNRTANDSTGRLILVENDNGASGTKMQYLKNGTPIMIFPGDYADFSFNSGTNKLIFIGGSSFDSCHKTGFNLFDDCIAGMDVASGAARQQMGAFVGIQSGGASGTHTNSFQDSTNKAIGCIDMSTLTATNSIFTLGTHSSSGLWGGLGCALSLVRATPLTALSDVSNRYIMYAGFHDGYFGAPVDGVYWKYDESISSVWRTGSLSNSSETVRDQSGFTVSISTMPYLGIFINGDWTNIQYFYSTDGVTWTIGNVHSTSDVPAANIPSGTSRSFGFGATIRKTAGTTARVASVDMLGYRYEFNRGS